jgi:RNA 2',3'-cyclic 3'-phosphodiesterase
VRIFVAVEIDEVVRRKAAAVSAGLRAALEQSRDRRSVAWIAPANLHLTLQFLGEIDPSRAKEVAGRLAPPFELPAFDVAVAGLGTFPPSGPTRVIWLGVADGAARLASLYREVASRLDGLGFPRDARPFHGHLTLGRVKTACGPRLRDAIARARAADAGRCRVDHVTLFESRLSQAGATYSVVATSPLGYHHTS